MADSHLCRVGEMLDHIRGRGWLVAVHNDYMQQGHFGTFWLFTKGNLAAKGESWCDYEALRLVSIEIEMLERR